MVGNLKADSKRRTMYFEVSEIFNQRRGDAGALVATSLFWKQAYHRPRGSAKVTLSNLLLSRRFIYGKHHSPWSLYVAPLLKGARILQKDRPDVTLRVYLADDLRFLIDQLVDHGCEVYVMEGSSIAHNPGAMWRFLALSEGERGVTVIDADRAPGVMADLARTEVIKSAGIGIWRVPYEFGVNYARNGIEGYRPMNASQFGVSVNYPTYELMNGFIEDALAEKVITYVKVRDEETYPIAGTRWPDYGFDEWFLQSCLYPRMVNDGALTFLPAGMPSFSQFLPLDVELATRANEKSEVVFFEDKVTRWFGSRRMGEHEGRAVRKRKVRRGSPVRNHKNSRKAII